MTLTLTAPVSQFGKTTVGGSSGTVAADFKQVSKYVLSAELVAANVLVYLSGGASTQVLKAVIYSDASGSPASLMTTSSEVTVGVSQAAGWVTCPVPFTTLPAGTYWIGFIAGATSGQASYRYDTVANQRAFNADTYSGGATATFGTPTVDSRELSVYVTDGGSFAAASEGSVSLSAASEGSLTLTPA